MRELKTLCRQNIWALSLKRNTEKAPYQHKEIIALDKNENPYNKPFNTYPDSYQEELRQKVADIKGISKDNIILSNGSNEAIDRIIRTFCEPHIDHIVTLSPSYDMYTYCAEINGVDYKSITLNSEFQTTADELLNACEENTKLIFICSPNTPSGNIINPEVIEQVLHSFEGIVIIDEAYIDFANHPSFLRILHQNPNLIILQTMSHAWASAAIRLGMTFASESIINLLQTVCMPYSLNILTQKHALEALNDPFETDKRVKLIKQERNRMMQAFLDLPCCEKVFPTETNFFLAKMKKAEDIYNYLIQHRIKVYDCKNLEQCDNCLRITIGTKTDNEALLAALRSYQ